MKEHDKILKIESIGVVENDFKNEIPDGYETLFSKIIIKPEFNEALHRIEENSHILVLFWMDRIEEAKRKTLKVHPKGRSDLPLLGVFTTRSPSRPNPIGIRAVRLVDRNENILEVQGLDALNGTPVLDIKPYSVKHDFVEDAKLPWWAKHLSKKEE